MNEIDECGDNDGDEDAKDDRATEIELPFAAIRAAHSRQKIIAVFLGIFRFKKAEHS